MYHFKKKKEYTKSTLNETARLEISKYIANMFVNEKTRKNFVIEKCGMFPCFRQQPRKLAAGQSSQQTSGIC
jgi:hypothetical protein